MKYTEIRGIICPVVTPMTEDGAVNYKELENQVERLIENGIHGVFAAGTNGEGYILTLEEKKNVIRTVIRAAAGRVPVYAGTGCISTRETIELSKEAEAMGADALSVITPSFAQASQEELYEHFCRVADAVKLPVVLYNIPARTGNTLSAATVGKLAERENIAAIKDSSGNFNLMLEYFAAPKGKEFTVLSGNDALIIWTLLAGGTGGVAGCANVFPQTMASIYNCFKEGKIEEARRINESIRPFRDCFRHGNPNTIVKTAVEILGYPVGSCRAPFNRVSVQAQEEISQVLKRCREAGMR